MFLGIRELGSTPTEVRSTGVLKVWRRFLSHPCSFPPDLPVGDDQRRGGDPARHRQQGTRHLREHAGDLRVPQQVSARAAGAVLTVPDGQSGFPMAASTGFSDG